MSTALSTAALDKHPQSKERGITLDLGFSSFTVPMPEHLQQLPGQTLQFTLVDCPGHASLIRTIIGGAQIIDMMILVVDVTKGIQVCLAFHHTIVLLYTRRQIHLGPHKGAYWNRTAPPVAPSRSSYKIAVVLCVWH